MTMRAVKIADLKSHLSSYLREVRAGKAVIVLDRNTPVARLVPIDAPGDVAITPPARDAPPIGKVKLPPPAGVVRDVVNLLLEDRRRR